MLVRFSDARSAVRTGTFLRYQKVYIRKCWRLFIVVVTTVLMMIGASEVFSLMEHGKYVEVPLASALRFELGECQLEIDIRVKEDADEMEVHYFVYRPFFDDGQSVPWSASENNGTWTFSLLNNIENLLYENCHVFMHIPMRATIGSLDVHCTGNCVIYSKPSGYNFESGTYLWSVAGAITVNSTVDSMGDFATVALGAVKAQSVNINLARGDVIFDNVEFGSSVIVVDEGDVHMHVNTDMTVNWTDSTSQYCLAAPSLSTVVNASSTCIVTPAPTQVPTAVPTNSPQGVPTAMPTEAPTDAAPTSSPTSAGGSCSGVMSLCENSTCQQSSSGAATGIPEVLVEVPRGSFYVTRSDVSGSKPAVSMGAAFSADGSFSLADETLSVLEEVKTVLTNSATGDAVFRMMGPQNAVYARPGIGFFFVASPSEAYQLLRPWVLAVLSWNLLVDLLKVETVNIRLKQGPCPYSMVLDQSGLSAIAQLVTTTALDTSLGNSLAYVMSSDSSPGMAGTFQFSDLEKLHNFDQSAYWPSISGSETWWKLNETEYEQLEVLDVSRSDPLLAALIFSLIIAFLLACFTAYLSLVSVSACVESFGISGAHLTHYYRIATLGEAEKKPDPHDGVKALPPPAEVQAGHDPPPASVDFAYGGQPSSTRPGPASTVVPVDSPGSNAATDEFGARETGDPQSGRGDAAAKQKGDMDEDDQEDLSVRDLSLMMGWSKMPSIFELPGIFADLPPIFGIMDHLRILFVKYWTNSLEEFLSLPGFVVTTEEGTSTRNSATLLADFRLHYSKYCFLRDKTELHLRKEHSLQIFEKRGLRLKALPTSEQLDAFVCIRWKAAREMERDQGLGTPHLRPGETSLDFFLRVMCVRTRFDEDRIYVDEFLSQYTWFCDKHRVVDVVTMSKAVMSQRVGIRTTRVTAYEIVPREDENGSIHEGSALVMKVAKGHVESMLTAQKGVVEQAIFGRWWWLTDALLVLLHVQTIWLCSVYLFSLPVVVIAMAYGSFSVADPFIVFKPSDMVYAPSKVINAMNGFPVLVWLLLFPGCLLMIVQYIHLVAYYILQKYPIDTLEYFSDTRTRRRSLTSSRRFRHLYKPLRPLVGFVYFSSKGDCEYFRSFMQACFCLLEWSIFFFLITMYSFWGSLFLVWCLLSAILNPEAFLAYTTAASTFIVFVVAKYAQMRRIFSMSLEEIVNHFTSIMAEKMNATLKTMVEGASLYIGSFAYAHGVGEFLDQAGDVIGQVAGDACKERFEQHVSMISGSSLGKIITSSGLDVSLVMKLATGEKTASQLFAEEHGLPVDLVHIMVALAEGNSEAVMKGIGDLLMKHQKDSPVSPELGIALAGLAFSPSRAKTEKCVQALYQHGLPMVLTLWSHQLNSPSGSTPAQVRAQLESLTGTVKQLQAENPELDVQAVSQALMIGSPELRQEALAKAIGVVTDPATQNAVLQRAEEVATDPSLREAAAAKLGELMEDPELQRLATQKVNKFLSRKLGATPAQVEMANMLLVDALPPLLKGIVALVAKQDCQKFVVSLRYVHNRLVEQKMKFIDCFGEQMFRNLENIGPLFHVLELVLRTGHIQEAILSLMQERSLLNLPREASVFLEFLLWLRVPKRSDAINLVKNPLHSKFMLSFSARQEVLESAVAFFQMKPEMVVLLEILMAFCLEDLRALTHHTIGYRFAKCVMSFADKAGMPMFKEQTGKDVLADCLRVAMTMLTTLRLGGEGLDSSLIMLLQNRTGLELEQMNEISQLFMHSEVSPVSPPEGMSNWKILGAAARHVGLDMNECVGLCHLCMGYTGTPEVTILIRELLRRQGVVPMQVDGLIKNLLAIEFAKTDSAVMLALQELRVKFRFLSLIGLGRSPPRYFSEVMLRSAGIDNPEVLRARLDVPFRYSDSPQMWHEWLEKAKRNMVGQDIGSWHLFNVSPMLEGDVHAETRPRRSNIVLYRPDPASQKGVKGLQSKLEARMTSFPRLAESPSGPQRKSLPGVSPALPNTPDHQPTPRTAMDPPGDMVPEVGVQRRTLSQPLAGDEAQRKVGLAQLSWLSGTFTETGVMDIVRHYDEIVMAISKAQVFVMASTRNPLDPTTSQGPNRLLHKEMSRAFGASQTPALLRKADVKVGATPGQEVGDYTEMARMRQLLELQDTSTGSLQPMAITRDQAFAVLRILAIKDMVQSKAGKGRSSEGKRTAVVQDFAQMLGVDSRHLAMLFDLVASERTKDAMNAAMTFGKAFVPEHTIEGVSQATYTIKRVLPVFMEVRHTLWDIARRFRLPRFFMPATLLPEISYPPQMREVGSVVHFVMAPVLQMPELNGRMQLVLYNLMGLVTGAPSRADLLVKTFGMKTKRGSQLANLIRMMLWSSISDKISFVPEVLSNFSNHFRQEERFDGLDKYIVDVFPFLLFFTGFPFATFPVGFRIGARSVSVLDMINEKTGIRTEVLRGIDLSQWSISPYSRSDLTSTTRESVIGLLLPLFASARVSMPHLPSDGLVKAIVSLAHCTTEHIEHLAEALRLNTFFLQLIVYLVDMSRSRAYSPAYILQVMQKIRMINGVAAQLNRLGLVAPQFLAILELTFPNMDDIPALPTLLEKAGLADLEIEYSLVSLFYALAVCGLLHINRDADPMRHEHYANSLSKVLEPIVTKLNFSQPLVPLIAARLFQGDFHVLGCSACVDKIQMLLPFTMERNLAKAVCGLLSQEPPEFKYRPVVLSGIVTFAPPKPQQNKKRKDGHECVGVALKDNPLPSIQSVFDFVVYVNGVRAQPEEFRCRAEISDRWNFKVYFTRPLDFNERIDVLWQAWPLAIEDPDQLRDAQLKAATNALRELETFCWNMRIHWGGHASIWWDEFDVHPLFLLLAMGDVHAIRLASDLLGVTDVVLAFLIGIVGTAEPDCLRPLLLADLCARKVTQCLSARSNTVIWNQLDPPPIAKISQPTPGITGDRKLRPAGYQKANVSSESVQLQKLRTEGSTNLFGDTFREVGLNKVLAKAIGADDDDDIDDFSQVVEPLSDDAAGADMFSDSDSEKEQDSEVPLEEEEEVNATTERSNRESARRAFKDWLEQLDPETFPDELLALFSSDVNHQPFRRRPQGMSEEVPEWCEPIVGRTQDQVAAFEAIAVDSIARFWHVAKDPSLLQDRADQHEWAELPENMHLLLNMMLVQLHVLLDDDSSPLGPENTCDKAPSVSLMLAFSKLHRAQLHCKSSKNMVDPQVMRKTMLPAMWGLEVHFRRGNRKLRHNLLSEVRNSTDMLMPGSDLAWGRGGISGFGLPEQLLEVEPGRNVEDWMWEDWTWPLDGRDELVEMFCRIAQIARLALGVSHPLGCWHPSDGTSTLRRVLHGKGPSITDEMGLQQRGWLALPHPQTESPMQNSRPLTAGPSIVEVFEGVDSDDEASPGIDFAAQASDEHRAILIAARRELWRDLTNTKMVAFILMCAASGADPVDGFYSLKQLKRFPSRDIEEASVRYAALSAMLSTAFGHRSDESELSPCTGVALWKLLPADATANQLGYKVAQWTQTLCPEIGLDPQTTEAMVNIAHGYVEDDNGDLICPTAFNQLTLRLRLPSDTGVKLLASICTKGWSDRSANVLAERLKIKGVVMHSMIQASIGDVRGWVNLHKSLFQVAQHQVEYEQRMLDACIAFSILGRQDRSDHVQEQVFRMKAVLSILVPILVGDRVNPGAAVAHCSMNRSSFRDPMTILKTSPEMTQIMTRLSKNMKSAHLDKVAMELLITTCAFVLHVLSGQNSAAATVLQEYSIPRQALQVPGEPDDPPTDKVKILADAVGLNSHTAQCFKTFTLLVGNRGKVLARDMQGAVDCLAEPLVDFVLHSTDVHQYYDMNLEPAIPNDATFCDEALDSAKVEQVTRERMKLLLDCIFGFSLRDNTRVLRVMRKIMVLNMESLLNANREILINSETMELRPFCTNPMQTHVRDMIFDNVAMRALTLVQSLRSFQRLRGLGARRKTAGFHSAVGVSSLSAMARSITSGSLQHSTSHLFASMRSGLEAQMLFERTVKVAVGLGEDVADSEVPDRLGSSGSQLTRDAQQELGSTPASGRASPTSVLRLDRLHSRKEKASASPDPTQVKAFHAMTHFFVALAASTHEGSDELRRFLPDFQEVLPVLAAASTGRFELILSGLRALAAKRASEDTLSEHCTNVDLLLDVVSLLGVDGDLYNKKGHDGDFVPVLLDRIFELVNLTDENLKGVCKRLVNLLIGLSVDAPAQNLQAQIWEACDEIRPIIEDAMESQDTLKAAICALIDSTRRVAAMVAEGKTVEQMELFKPGPSGQEAMAICMLRAVFDLVLPFMAEELRSPLTAMLRVMSELSYLSADPTLGNFIAHRMTIVEHLAVALCIPKHSVSGIFALARGDWAEAAEFCRPFCDINEEVLMQMSRLLPSVRNVILPSKQDETRWEDMAALLQNNNARSARVKQIATDVLQEKGSVSELFELTDIDGNGKISVEELRMLMTRLGFNLNEHRLNEILSKCKKSMLNKKREDIKTSDLDGLNETEFKMALDYLQQRVAVTSLDLLGNSWSTLVSFLIFLCLVLLLACVFIILGISAFSTGGVFHAVINSAATIAAGIGLAQKKAGQTVQDSDSKDKIRSLVEEVKDTVYGDQ